MAHTTKRLNLSDLLLETEPVLTPREVAALFRVDPKTVTRWAAKGLACQFTPGGHRRFRESEVRAYRRGERESPMCATCHDKGHDRYGRNCRHCRDAGP